MATKIESEFSFQESAIYKIKVEGVLQENWIEKFQGLKISVERSLNGKPVSVLRGKINDQSALSGLLNMLYDYNMTILSVKMLKS
ncbi:MAG: hypothetical protein ABJJ25_10370 [Eudoraea sp.]|uniref:hypothetical protein n=1 Tax=Eudoraea sp. TaxID=1979955 RepID=UPI0032646155